MISRVLVQKQGNEFVSANGYTAWRGFSDRGFETQFFEWPSLRDGKLVIDPSTLIVGGSGTVTHALSRLGVAIPTIEDLPEPLSSFRERHIQQSTLGKIRSEFNSQASAVFIKPISIPKAFPATVIKTFRDFIPSSKYPDEFSVLVSDPVDFVSEWRFFVLRGRVVGAGWYLGNPLIFPNTSVVSNALDCWGDLAPAGYGIDFGVTADQRTILVEVNEGYSLGCLGLNPFTYSQILEARWIELTQ